MRNVEFCASHLLHPCQEDRLQGLGQRCALLQPPPPLMSALDTPPAALIPEIRERVCSQVSKHVHIWQFPPRQRPDPMPNSPKSHSHRGTSSLVLMPRCERPTDRFGKSYALEGAEDVSSGLLCIHVRMTLLSCIHSIRNSSMEASL